ncbi:secretory subunit [Recurvomyces mirabilis]|uniref:Secretory subunit n=1 Tax=Recurvomyces mirabilis TaxID=574656 RepID=A0AAE0TQ49_9PEZI|nr:secretory subunit [Recurvomyces mirabilis]KAK5161054.1 secretory subunit [Recurvomyces mirabilis]
MSSEYNYDADAQFFPFFVLTITSLTTIPLTYTLLRAPSDGATTSKRAAHINSEYQPDNSDIIDTQRAKQKRKELRLKRILFAVSGWLTIAWMVYLMAVTARAQPKIWNPYDILDVGLSASEKQINSRYRRLSVTMHPDKRQPNPALNETSESVNDQWVEIVKAYKALTDEEVRNNYVQYGNPDGKQSTSFGIALPQFLVAEGSGKYVLVLYGLLLGIGLPWLVGKWWYGMQKLTKEKVLITTAGNMFREFKERMDEGDVVAAVSSAMEYKEILSGANADAGLGKLEKKLQAADSSETGMLAKDKRKLEESEEAARRKTLALIWAYLSRLELDDKSLEAEKYELAPTTLQMNEAFVSISLAYGFTSPVLASYHLSQSLVQAVAPGTDRLPLMQLPHFTPSTVQTIEQKTVAGAKKEHLTIQNFMALPAEQRQALATAAGLSKNHLSAAESVAKQLPLLKIEKAFFKVQGEKHLLPSSLVQFVVKARFIPPGTPASAIPPLKDSDLQDIDPAEGDIEAQKKEIEQHPIPFAHAPYLAKDRSPRWHIFLADNRQGKIAVPPFTFSTFDKMAFEDDGKGSLKPTFEVVTLKMQFQAPPQAGEYRFQMNVICDSYIGFDHKQDAIMDIADPASIPADVEEVAEDDISEPEEDSIAGQMASLRGQPTSDPAEREAKEAARAERQRRRDEQRKAIQAKGGKEGEGEESDYESGTDEDEESVSETDTETDSDEEAAKKKGAWW